MRRRYLPVTMMMVIFLSVSVFLTAEAASVRRVKRNYYADYGGGGGCCSGLGLEWWDAGRAFGLIAVVIALLLCCCLPCLCLALAAAAGVNVFGGLRAGGGRRGVQTIQTVPQVATARQISSSSSLEGAAAQQQQQQQPATTRVIYETEDHRYFERARSPVPPHHRF